MTSEILKVRVDRIQKKRRDPIHHLLSISEYAPKEFERNFIIYVEFLIEELIRDDGLLYQTQWIPTNIGEIVGCVVHSEGLKIGNEGYNRSWAGRTLSKAYDVVRQALHHRKEELLS